MKKIILFSAIVGISIISCKKEEEPTPATPTPVAASPCMPTLSVQSESGQPNDSSWYFYNSSDKIVKIKYSWGYDTVIYATSGAYSMVKEYKNWDSSFTTYTYTYSGNNITQIVENGTKNGTPYTKTSTITYNSSNKPTSVVSTGDPDGNMGIINITWSGSEPTGADLDMDGTGAVVIECSVTTDGKRNIHRFFPPTEGGSVIDMLGSNILNITSKNSETIPSGSGTTTVPAGTKIFQNTYTYNSYNEVTQRVEIDGMDPSATPRTTSYTLDCQ